MRRDRPVIAAVEPRGRASNASEPMDLQANRRLIDRAVTTAATAGATWILTPELCICGYDFTDDLGTAWIVPPPDPWMASLCQRAAHLGVTVFLSHPERDAQSEEVSDSGRLSIDPESQY